MLNKKVFEKDKLLKKYLIFYSIIFFLITLIIFFPYIFMNKLYIYTDIGSDTINLYWPCYKYIISNIKSGTLSFWSFNWGIGTNILSMSSLVFDPFNIVLLMFPINKIVYGILVAMILKLYTAGLIFYLYLDYIKINKKVSLISSIIWSYNGFIILWGQHYMFASAIVFFTLVTYGLERFLRENKKGIFIIALVELLITSPYFAYAVSIYIFLYSIIRYFYYNNFKLRQFIYYIINLIKVYITTIGISSILFLPECALILNSSRVSGIERSLPDFLDNNIYTIITKLLRVFGNNLLLMDSKQYLGQINYYEDMILASSVIMIVMLPQLFIIMKRKNKCKFMVTIFAISVISIFSPIVAYTFNAFSTIAYRWSYIIIFEIILSGTIVLNDFIENKNLNMKVLIATVISSIIILVVYVFCVLNKLQISMLDNNIHILRLQVLILSCIMILFVLVLFMYKKSNKKICIYFILVLAIGDISLNGVITTDYRDVLTSDYLYSNTGYYDNDTDEAIKYIKSLDKSFYRLDKDYFSQSWNDSMFQDYFGLSTYNSLNTDSYFKFCDEFYNRLPINTNIVEDFNGDNFIRSFLGTKYILSKNSNLHFSNGQYKYIKKIGNVYIYENLNAFPLGFTYDKYVLKNKFESKDYANKSHLILNSVVLDSREVNLSEINADDIIENCGNISIQTNNIQEIKNENGIIEYIPTNDDPNITIELNEDVKNGLILEFDAQVSQNTNAQYFYDIGNGFNEEDSIKSCIYTNKNHYSIPLDYNNIKALRIDIGHAGEKITIKNLIIHKRQPIDKILNNRDLFIVDQFENSHILGRIEAQKDELLMWTIPYAKGWTVKVDGKKTDVFNVNCGFIGIDISKGKHVIELEYTTPGLKLGSIISLITILIVIFNKRKNLFKLIKINKLSGGKIC